MRRAANHLYENEPKAQNAFDSFLNPYDIVRGSEPFERQELHGFRLGEVAAVEQVGAHGADGELFFAEGFHRIVLRVGGSSLMAEAGWKLEATPENPWAE